MKKSTENIGQEIKITVLLGLVILPAISFSFLLESPESPLYASISRIAWIHGRWISTFIWALAVMGTIGGLTHLLVKNGPLEGRQKRGFLAIQLITLFLAFIGCLMFPAKPDQVSVRLIHHLHDFLTAIAWVAYVIGLIVYSLLIGRKNKFLGFMSCSIMTFVILSSLFFLIQVIDPTSYVGASAVSEVYVINSLLIYLVIMYLLEKKEMEKPLTK